MQWNSHGVEPKGNALVTRDFMGVTVDALEKRHGCPTIYFQGAIGGLMGTPDTKLRKPAGDVTTRRVRATFAFAARQSPVWPIWP